MTGAEFKSLIKTTFSNEDEAAKILEITKVHIFRLYKKAQVRSVYVDRVEKFLSTKPLQEKYSPSDAEEKKIKVLLSKIDEQQKIIDDQQELIDDLRSLKTAYKKEIKTLEEELTELQAIVKQLKYAGKMHGLPDEGDGAAKPNKKGATKGEGKENKAP